ncbi:MAG: SMC-Scp complex subunit ScpB [Verrucomicrobiota bacterium]|nr:SMC-Scp complex subunit ScpB [Verrucomicrobiota bacterium]
MVLKAILESIFFAAQKPLDLKDLKEILKDTAELEPNEVTNAFKKVDDEHLVSAIQELKNDYDQAERAFQLQQTGETWQLASRAEYASWVKQMFDQYKPQRLSASAMETLAIVAYRQPITRADIEAVRGVAVDSMVQILLDRGLVKISGRAETPGRPMLYATTEHFLEHFGIKDVNDLPNSAELRYVKLKTAETPAVSVDPEPSVAVPESVEAKTEEVQTTEVETSSEAVLETNAATDQGVENDEPPKNTN